MVEAVGYVVELNALHLAVGDIRRDHDIAAAVFEERGARGDGAHAVVRLLGEGADDAAVDIVGGGGLKLDGERRVAVDHQERIGARRDNEGQVAPQTRGGEVAIIDGLLGECRALYRVAGDVEAEHPHAAGGRHGGGRSGDAAVLAVSAHRQGVAHGCPVEVCRALCGGPQHGAGGVAVPLVEAQCAALVAAVHLGIAVLIDHLVDADELAVGAEGDVVERHYLAVVGCVKGCNAGGADGARDDAALKIDEVETRLLAALC